MRENSFGSLLPKQGHVAKIVAAFLPVVLVVCAIEITASRTLGAEPETRKAKVPAIREGRRPAPAALAPTLIKRAIVSLNSESANIQVQGRKLTEKEQQRLACNSAAVVHLEAALTSLKSDDKKEQDKKDRPAIRAHRPGDAAALIRLAITSLERESASIQIQGRALTDNEKATVKRNAAAVKHLRQALSAFGEENVRPIRPVKRPGIATAMIRQAQRQLQSEAGSIERVGRALTERSGQRLALRLALLPSRENE